MIRFKGTVSVNMNRKRGGQDCFRVRANDKAYRDSVIRTVNMNRETQGHQKQD